MESSEIQGTVDNQLQKIKVFSQMKGPLTSTDRAERCYPSSIALIDLHPVVTTGTCANNIEVGKLEDHLSLTRWFDK